VESAAALALARSAPAFAVPERSLPAPDAPVSACDLTGPPRNARPTRALITGSYCATVPGPRFQTLSDGAGRVFEVISQPSSAPERAGTESYSSIFPALRSHVPTRAQRSVRSPFAGAPSHPGRASCARWRIPAAARDACALSVRASRRVQPAIATQPGPPRTCNNSPTCGSVGCAGDTRAEQRQWRGNTGGVLGQGCQH
jgi:hypothetical protein